MSIPDLTSLSYVSRIPADTSRCLGCSTAKAEHTLFEARQHTTGLVVHSSQRLASAMKALSTTVRCTEKASARRIRGLAYFALDYILLHLSPFLFSNPPLHPVELCHYPEAGRVVRFGELDSRPDRDRCTLLERKFNDDESLFVATVTNIDFTHISLFLTASRHYNAKTKKKARCTHEIAQNSVQSSRAEPS